MLRLVLALLLAGVAPAFADSHFQQMRAQWDQEARAACLAFPTGRLLSAYNGQVTTFQGRPIKWVQIRGSAPNPQQASLWTLDDKLIGFQCSAYGLAYTTDGSSLQVTAPLIFQASADGSRLIRFAVGLYAPGL